MKITKLVTAAILLSFTGLSFATSGIKFIRFTNKPTEKSQATLLSSKQSSRSQYDPGYTCWSSVEGGYDDWAADGGTCFGASLTVKGHMAVEYSCQSAGAPEPLICDGQFHSMFPEDPDKDNNYAPSFFQDAPYDVVLDGMSDDVDPEVPQFDPFKMNVVVSLNNCKMSLSGVMSMKGFDFSSYDIAGKAFNCMGDNAISFVQVAK